MVLRVGISCWVMFGTKGVSPQYSQHLVGRVCMGVHWVSGAPKGPDNGASFAQKDGGEAADANLSSSDLAFRSGERKALL